MVHRNIEEALDLGGVQVHGQHAVHAGGGQQVGHQLGGNGNAGLVLAVLAGVPEEGDHRGDASGAGTAGGVHHHAQFHDVMVGGGAGGLNEENILAADVFIYLYKTFPIGESVHRDVRQLNAYALRNALRKFSVCCTADNLHTGN